MNDSNIYNFANDVNYPENLDDRSFFQESTEDMEFNTIIALESHYGYLRNLGASEAERILRSMFASRILTYHDIERDDILEGAIISRKYSIRSNDATIIANMLKNGKNKIATDNVRDFSRHPEIEVYNPITRPSRT